MIVWLNGAFGSGKTHTANEIHRRLVNSYIYDPEEIGFALRKLTPKSLWKPDFQDETYWREFNYRQLLELDKSYNGIIIIPMTLTNPEYYREIIVQLRDAGVDVRHFVLWATESTLVKRLHNRGEGKKSWAYEQIPRCLAAFEDATFEGRIVTDGLTLPEVAEEVALRCGLTLAPRCGRLAAVVNWARTTFAAIRR